MPGQPTGSPRVENPPKSYVMVVKYGEHEYPASMRQRWHRYPGSQSSCYYAVNSQFI